MDKWLPTNTSGESFFGVDRTMPPGGWLAHRVTVRRPWPVRLWRSLVAGLRAVRDEWKWGG